MSPPKLKIPVNKLKLAAMEAGGPLGSPYPSPRNLVASLITISQALASYDTRRFLHKQQADSVVRKLHILSILFEEMKENESPMPASAVLCLRELSATMRSMSAFLEECGGGSRLWQLMEAEAVLHRFRELTEDMANALEILPLKCLPVSEELTEHVQLVYLQLRKAWPWRDPAIEGLRAEILCMVNDLTHRQITPSPGRISRIMSSLSLVCAADCDKEIQLLEDEILAQAGTGGVAVVSTINNLIRFINAFKEEYFSGGGDHFHGAPPPSRCDGLADEASTNPSQLRNPSPAPIPDEFRCPISVDLMMDPVVIATGHTYDRSSITKWLESGESTCPKSGQKLLHVSLIPNYALRSIMCQWCAKHGVLYEKHGRDGGGVGAAAVDHIGAMMAGAEAAKAAAAFLVGKLATGAPEVQRQAAYELRLLAKCGTENRVRIAEAGAIPFLLPLLGSSDGRAQENAVTALLNLSICESNRALIVASGALDAIVRVLGSGATTEARENAAATLFSLSIPDENKAAIGGRPGAIHGLIDLLRHGSSRGKKDAATALFNISLHGENKPKVVAAGGIPLLLELLRDEKAGITDDALAVLAVLAASPEGLIVISEAQAIPLLVEILRLGSDKGKENSISVLLALCRSGGEDIIRCILQTTMPSLQKLASFGSPRAKRKAASLLKLLSRYGPLHQQE